MFVAVQKKNGSVLWVFKFHKLRPSTGLKGFFAAQDFSGEVCGFDPVCAFIWLGVGDGYGGRLATVDVVRGGAIAFWFFRVFHNRSLFSAALSIIIVGLRVIGEPLYGNK